MSRALSIAISISVLVGLLGLMAAPAFAAIPARAKSPDSPEPVVIRMVPRTTEWVMRPTPASSIIVIGSPPIIIGGSLIVGPFHRGFGVVQHPPVYIHPDSPYGPPTFFR